MVNIFEIIPIFVCVIGVVIAITSAIATKKRKANAADEQDNKPQSAVAAEQEKMTAHEDAKKQRATAANDRKNRAAAQQAARSSEVSDISQSKPLSKQKSESGLGRPPHKHAAAAPSVGQRIRTEARPAPSGSLDAESVEGCEHDERLILEDIVTADNTSDADTRELQRLMVWSEILNKPKFKRF